MQARGGKQFQGTTFSGNECFYKFRLDAGKYSLLTTSDWDNTPLFSECGCPPEVVMQCV